MAARNLDAGLSIYLDVLRFGAASVVLLAHAFPVLYPDLHLAWPGRAAVIVFFVLSGMLIAHAAARPNVTIQDFALSRLVRIWSVAIPALALSAMLAPVVGDPGLGPVAPVADSAEAILWRVLTNVCAAGDLWYAYFLPPLNGPYWSVNYEVWYYLLFGAFLFARGWLRLFLVGTIVVAIGPVILAMFPIWLLGVGLYHHRPAYKPLLAVALLVASGLAALAYLLVDGSSNVSSFVNRFIPGIEGVLRGSQKFSGDFVFALIVSVHVSAAGSLGRFAAPLLLLERPIRWLAGMSFSIYLYHMPLLVLLAVTLKLPAVAVWAGLITLITALASLTERQLPLLKRSLRNWIQQGALLRTP